MASVFAWLDFSDKERRDALEVIDLFREEDTRDELGLGVVRDTFSDLLFPGTSTIQTRARYFLFIPWLLQDLETRRGSGADWARRARHLQGRLRDSLIKGGEEDGIIGYRAGINVQRLPHSVYWQGLRRWGILRFHGSEDEYLRSLDLARHRRKEIVRTDDGEPAGDAPEPNWDPNLPEPPDGLLKSATFDLSAQEADYLMHRIAISADDSLLYYLIDLRKPVDETTRFIWQHLDQGQLPDPLQSHVSHARNFSESMHGAALLYNLMLAEEKGKSDLVNRYERRLAEWWDLLRQRSAGLASWDRHDFWQTVRNAGGRIPPQTLHFIETWWDLAFGASSIDELLASGSARQLIEDRERRLKRSRARIGNPRALELWSGAAGTAQMDYRWGRPVATLINDILAPQIEGD